MAHMIPTTPPRYGPGRDAERLVYEALRGSLDDETFVYHSLKYHHAGCAGEGEIDFLVLHREHGMLVIECKGGGVELDGHGNWWRLVGDGQREAMRESPFDQAKRQLWQLVEVLKPRYWNALSSRKGEELPFAFGYAVAFPKTLVDDLVLPPDFDRTLVIDAGDLGRVHQKLLAILAQWQAGRRRTPLSKPEFKRFRKEVLHPPLRIAPTLGGAIAANRETFIRMTETQCRILEMFLANRRLRVTGGAGTGKTVLALEAARCLAGEGAEVLFLCFNKALGAHLGAQVEAAPPGAGRIRVAHFHRHGVWAYHALEREFSPPPREDKEASRRFWDDEVTDTMLEAIEAGALPRYDAIVVDEGQDFAPGWWEVILESLEDREQGPLVVFYDPSQEIFGREGAVPDLPTTLPLRHNFRNTREICRAVQRLGRVDMEPHPDCPEGERVRVHPLESAGKTRDRVLALLERLIGGQQVPADQIAILTPHSRDNSSLTGLDAIGPYPLAEDPGDRAGRVLHTTIGGFKGLESEVLILLDVDPADPRCFRNARYVASSRARQLLHVFAKGDWLAD